MPASRAGRYPAVIAAPDAVHECPLTRHAVDSDLLDCVNDNLAVMLAQLGVNDVRTPFACQWHLGFDRDGAEPSLSLYRRSPAEIISEQTGWTIVARPLQVDHLEDACAELLHRGPVLLYGDAFHLQWLPYFGREHQLHSFIVDWLSPERSRVHIVDAYSNKTQWGEASPTELFLETANLPGLLARDELGRLRSAETLERFHLPARVNLRSLLIENARGIAEAAERGVFASFAGFYRERLDEPSVVKRFVVQCWLAARARGLHARWLAELETREPKLLPEGFASEFATSIAAGWTQVSAFAYVLLRKIEQGKPPILTPFALIDALANREGSAARAVSALLGAE